ncbi:hypothetical protein Syun_012818 [Stephania yunnanensis]|uniref:Uncharacterized protein n=1 Tax=Stephania yunnanensis TaxID=152371 RepID=A0AAP0K1I4_9MAGN
MRGGGLIACGSESGEVFVYDERWGEPIWVRGLSTVGDDGEIGMDGGDDERRFVGSVGWRDVGEGECTLVAGGSDGILQVFEVKVRFGCMGASHWFPKPNKFRYSNFMVTATVFHEWEMNFNPTLQNQATISSSSNHQQHQQQQEEEESLLREPYQDHQSDQEKARSKLSSLKWKPNSNSPTTLGSGDYDGVVTEYDLDRQIPVFERDEHGGRRVWSIDYSSPSTGVSGSDDGTMQVRDTRCTTSGGLVGLAQPSKTKSAVCCVEFSPFDGDMSVGLGCSDKRVYVYDVRNFKSPILVLSGHERTVSYVRFLGEKKLVSGGTDGFLKMWDLESGRVIRCYRGTLIGNILWGWP